MELYLNKTSEKNLIKILKKQWFCNQTFIYIWVDVWKTVLDVSVVIWDSEMQEYLGTIQNNISWFKQIEKFILKLVQIWINENNIFFACENTGVYTHDCMDYFDSRLPNTYILKSSLTFQARKYYAKADFKTDLLDSAVVALTLNDLHQKWKLECLANPYNKDKVWIGFVRRSFWKEMCSLRHIFRMLAELRNKKSELVTSIWQLQYRVFPELDGIFECRSKTKKNLVNLFTRDQILKMNFSEFANEYRNRFWNRSLIWKISPKVKQFFLLVQNRGKKTMHSNIDSIAEINDLDYILDNIHIKFWEYDFIVQEMENLKISASKILYNLQQNWFFIPQFRWVSQLEMWLFLWELGQDIYEMSPHSLLWFAGRHPNVYESGGWNPTKSPRFSTKKSIIKKYLYVRMWWFCMHNPSFRLYKNLLSESYWITTEKSVTNSRLKKKIWCKAGDKFLKIILVSFKNKSWFDENIFIVDTILPLVDRMKNDWIKPETISSIIENTYKTAKIPDLLKQNACHPIS